MDFDGEPHYGGRQMAYCNSIQCDQRYWWYPQSRRVTLRNSGPTWQEMRARLGRPTFQEPEVLKQAREAYPEVFKKPRPKRKLGFRVRRLLHRTWRVIRILGYNAQGARV